MRAASTSIPTEQPLTMEETAMEVSANVIAFRPAKKLAKPRKLTLTAARKLGRQAWEDTLRAYWADPKNWQATRRGEEIAIDIGKKMFEATIEPKGGYWIWRLQFEDMSIESPWIFVTKETAFADALAAVLAVV
jgi:hypothetical protein